MQDQCEHNRFEQSFQGDGPGKVICMGCAANIGVWDFKNGVILFEDPSDKFRRAGVEAERRMDEYLQDPSILDEFIIQTSKVEV